MANGAAARCEWTSAATGMATAMSGECRAAGEASLDGVVGSDRPGGGVGGVAAEGDPGGENWGCSEETVG
jgi:hypothetical protein